MERYYLIGNRFQFYYRIIGCWCPDYAIHQPAVCLTSNWKSTKETFRWFLIVHHGNATVKANNCKTDFKMYPSYWNDRQLSWPWDLQQNELKRICCQHEELKSLPVWTPSSVLPQVTSCWASMELIWLSWPTVRQFRWWRLRRLSLRWYSASSRPSPRTQRRTPRLSRWTNWTLWTTYEMTPSTGHRCGLDGWDYPGTSSLKKPGFSSSSFILFIFIQKTQLWPWPCRFSHMHWCRDIVLQKTNNESWGFSIVGGYEESQGQQPFFIKTIVPGTPAHFDGRLK